MPGQPVANQQNRPCAPGSAAIPLLTDSDWQMSFGERAALEGVLGQFQPSLSIEIGTAEGGSLERISAHSGEVHSFDLVEPKSSATELGNVQFHTGDSHKLLPELLSRFAEESRNVDFVLVDGDHSAKGVETDLADLLDSPAVARTVIIIHDTMNETVRSGVEMVPFEGYPKVSYVELDLVAGYMFRVEALRHELWGGLGIVTVDSGRKAYNAERVRQDRYYEAHDLVRFARDHVVHSGDASLPNLDSVDTAWEQAAHARLCLEKLQQSASWRFTAPLRRAKSILQRR